jgi:protein-S-isoprenylcysteine O-methyltransferase Ste14
MILPDLVVLIFAVLMYLLDRFLPFGEFDFFGRQLLIWVLGIAALLICFVAIAQFLKVRTTLDPGLRSQSSILVTGGIYAYSRNPMYLAMLLLLLAWGLWLGNAFNTLLAALFVAYMNRFQIGPEEEALRQIFGKDYQKYCLEVRRWF